MYNEGIETLCATIVCDICLPCHVQLNLPFNWWKVFVKILPDYMYQKTSICTWNNKLWTLNYWCFEYFQPHPPPTPDWFCPVCHSVILSETLTVNNFWTVFARAVIFHMSIPFWGYKHFWPNVLDLGVWPIFGSFNLAYNIWTAWARALIFHKNISIDMTFLGVSKF